MIINRIFCLPNKWTFIMKPIHDLFARYDVGNSWADPFSGLHSPAEVTNDIEQRASYKMDGFDFLCSLDTEKFCGILFDPPYSVEQCLRRYTPKHGGTAGRAEYWSKCKDEMARIIKVSGYAICFAWDSTGLGKKRGFELIEVLLINHGACHNDTIVTVEQKVKLGNL